MNVDRHSIQYGAAGNDVARDRQTSVVNRNRSVMRPHRQPVGAQQIDRCVIGVAEPSGTFSDGVQHRLNVRRRPGDHLQYRAGRCLLLERFSHLACPRLHLVEKAHVLDGDHRLVGEGLDQFDLPLA